MSRVFLGVKLHKAPHSTAASGSHHQLGAAWLKGPTSSFSSSSSSTARRALLYFCAQTAHPALKHCAQIKKNNNPKTTNSFSALTLCIRRKTFFFKNSFTIVHTCVCDWTRPLRTRSASQSSCDLRRQITKAICNFFFISLLHICDLHALTYVYVRLLDLPTLSLLAPLYYSTEKYMAEYGFYFSIKKRLRGKLETEDK